MSSSRRAPLVLVAMAVAACSSPPQIAGEPLQPVGNAQAFEGVQCNAVRPPTEPDLMGWDAGSRLNLKRLRSKGMVAVRYEASGCNVRLELLSNCLGAGPYEYTAYSANERKVANNATELYAQLPVGAASLAGRVKGDRGLRTDYMLVGQYALGPTEMPKRSMLRGLDCGRATHVVSAVYVGGFALVAGEHRRLEAEASVFGVGAGGQQVAGVERLADEGNAEACKKAQQDQQASGACDVPLRIALMKLDEVPTICPEGTVQQGDQCMRRVSVVECPGGTRWDGTKCAATVDTTCAGGTHFVAGKGCLADLAPPPAAATQAVGAASRGGQMVRIPGGTFQMGSNDGDADEKPAHPVTVETFELDRTEVTVRAYGECVAAGGCSEPNHYENTPGKWGIFCNWRHPEGRETHPINCVDWEQSSAYCRWAGKRLPSEEEWEYAARRDGRTYPWGDESPSEKRLNACGPECVANGRAKGFSGWKPMPWGNDGWPETAPVGSFHAGASPDGIEDLAGNVWEWTSSGYSESYSENRANDQRVVRGGSWGNVDPAGVRAAFRGRNAPTNRFGNLGFRCAR